MATTGVNIHFTKHVTTEEESPSPSSPADNKGGDFAGEGKDSVTLKRFVSVDRVLQSAVRGLNTVTSTITGSSALQAQSQALNQGLSQGVSLLTTAMINPAAAGVQALIMVGEYAVNEFKFSQTKAWSDYDLEQYRARRGYSGNRSRS